MMIASAVRESLTRLGSQAWRTPNRIPTLRHGELHVWFFPIDRSREHVLGPTLSQDEVERAGKFKRAGDRADFVVCRGALRFLLGHYAGLEPASVQIFYTEDGKPFVDNSATSLKFNLSHSQEYALFGFGLGFDMGVDIEQIDGNVIDQGMLSHCLHDNELEIYNSLSVDEKAAFFFKCWTRKEAYLKLRGDGFAVSPTEIDLLSMQGIEFGFDGDPACFTELPHINAYAATIATRTKPQNISCYKLDSSLFR